MRNACGSFTGRSWRIECLRQLGCGRVQSGVEIVFGQISFRLNHYATAAPEEAHSTSTCSNAFEKFVLICHFRHPNENETSTAAFAQMMMFAAQPMKKLLDSKMPTNVLALKNFLFATLSSTREYDGSESGWDCIIALGRILNLSGRADNKICRRYLATAVGGTGMCCANGIPPEQADILRLGVLGTLPLWVVAYVIADFSAEDCVAYARFVEKMELSENMQRRRSLLLECVAVGEYLHGLRVGVMQFIAGAAVFNSVETLDKYCSFRLLEAEKEILEERHKIALAYWRKEFLPLLMRQLFGLASLNLPALCSLMILDHWAPWIISDYVPTNIKCQYIKVVSDACEQKVRC